MDPVFREVWLRGLVLYIHSLSLTIQSTDSLPIKGQPLHDFENLNLLWGKLGAVGTVLYSVVWACMNCNPAGDLIEYMMAQNHGFL